MFQLEYPESVSHEVESVLLGACGGRSVLIHPLLADEVASHTIHAKWLGPVLPMALEKL
jgi:DOPA 4,5-dioxygenase